ncbi:MAG: RNA polymerase sigma factor [Myxococcota bacterium]
MSGRVIPIRRFDGRVEEMSDEALVAACAVADQAALSALFDRHHLRVHRFLCRVAGVRSSEAEDLLQDTFAAAWVSAKRYRGDSPALTWLFGIAANVARNHVRGRERGARALTTLLDEPQAPSPRADETAEKHQALVRLDKALRDLPHDHRVALVMCDLEGATGNDAAKALGVRPGTIWRWLHEARKDLRVALDEGSR